MRDDILLVDGFLDAATCERLAGVDFDPAPGRHDQPAAGLMPQGELDDIVHRVSEQLGQWFETGPLFCDYAAASKSTTGMGHVEHADAETLEGEPNHCPWRTVTAMLYLNSYGTDFGGGVLHFTRLGQVVEPTAGLLVGFRCDGAHTHEVPAVQWGTRRALAFWFTTDPAWAGVVSPKGA